MTLRRLTTGPAVILALAALHPVPAEATGSISGVSAVPSPVTAGSEVAITLAGSGTCATYVTFGDNQKSARLTQLPGTVKHVYTAPGKYVVRSLSYRSGNEPPGLSPCSGFADMELVVKAKPGTKVVAPNRNSTGAATEGGGFTGMTYRKIPVTPQAGKPVAQDSWQTAQQTTPSPTPTPTKAAK